MSDFESASLRTLGGSQISSPFRLGACAPRGQGGQVRFLNGVLAIRMTGVVGKQHE